MVLVVNGVVVVVVVVVAAAAAAAVVVVVAVAVVVVVGLKGPVSPEVRNTQGMSVTFLLSWILFIVKLNI